MATLSRSDACAALLWLGLVAALILQLALPRPPQVSEAAMPQPQDTPPPAAEEAMTDPAPTTKSALRTVSLPPPPPPPSVAPTATTETPPTETSAPIAEPPKPAPPPQTVVEPLRATPQRVAERQTRALVPLRPAPKPQAEKPAPEAPAQAPPTPIAKPLPPVNAPPEPKAPPRQVQEPAPAPKEVASEREAATVTVSQSEAKEGRTLLRLLEHGSGPEIELAWPDTSAERRRLYGLLHGCFGMRVGVMDASGRLYRAANAGAVAWTPNLDHFSGFLRSPNGRLAPEEERIVRTAGAGLASAAAVRLFPRRVDALLLGGLRTLIGPDYPSLRTIHARYRLRSGRVLIEAISGDARPYPGTIDLSPAAPRSCGHAVS